MNRMGFAAAASAGRRTSVTVDFGPGTGAEETLASVSVPAPAVSATPAVFLSVQGVSPDHDPDDAAVEGVCAYVTSVTAGVGFDVAVTAPDGTWGEYLVNCFYFP